MQGSFTRSQAAGKIQEQLQQRGQVGQDIITTAQKKEAEQKRKQVNKSDSSDASKLEPDKENKKEKQQHDRNSKKKHNKQQENDVQHPFKGNFIDYSG